MRHTGSVALLAALTQLLFVTAALADPADSAPPLAAGQFSVHIAGTLSDAIEELKRVTGWQVGLNTTGRDGHTVSMEAPVMLDFDDTPLDAILVSLCEQAGLTYDESGSLGKWIALWPGDPKLDPRPTVVVGDYTVRISSMLVSSTSTLEWRWGAPPPDPDGKYSLGITFDVTCKTPEARHALARLDGQGAATCDNGLVLRTESNAQLTHSWSPIGPLTVRYTMQLPAPPEGPTRLDKIEGALRLYSDVKSTVFRLEPADRGTTVEQDGCAVTVTKWEQTGNTVVLELQEKHPAPPVTPQAMPGDAFALRAVDLAGKEQSVTGFDGLMMPTFAGPDGVRNMSYTFNATGELSHVLLTIVRRSGPEKVVPFVFESVPLP